MEAKHTTTVQHHSTCPRIIVIFNADSIDDLLCQNIPGSEEDLIYRNACEPGKGDDSCAKNQEVTAPTADTTLCVSNGWRASLALYLER